MNITLNIHFNFTFPQKRNTRKRHCYYVNCRFQVPQEAMLASHIALSIRLHPGGLQEFVIPLQNTVYNHPNAELTSVPSMQDGYFDLSYYKEFKHYEDGNRILLLLKKGGDSRFRCLQKMDTAAFDQEKSSCF